MCVVCETRKEWLFILKGQLPKGSQIDRKYELYLDPLGYLEVTGYFYSKIFWDNKNKTYVIFDVLANKVMAAAENPNLVGLNSWNIGGDHYILKLHQCSTSEFACFQQGDCISMEYRCDGKIDCPGNDNSDETDCSVVSTLRSYKKESPPQPQKKGTKVKVYVDLLIDWIVAIRELEMEFVPKFLLFLKWRDPRLTYKNLRSSETENNIRNTIEKLWIPELIFDNTNILEMTKVKEDAELTVRMEGQALDSPYDDYYENRIFKGSENTLILSGTYTVTLSCNFRCKSEYPK